MSWPACNWHTDRTRRRATAWHCPHDRRLVIRHCGHPTALRPYYVELAGRSYYAELGAFRLLPQAQLAALQLAASLEAAE